MSSWTECGCEECHNAIDVFISHYKIGLDMICAGNKPGLDVRIRRSRGCVSEKRHIPGWNK